MPQITIIAEIGINHGGDINLLKELAYQAKKCGCDIAKTQLYDPIKLFPNKQIMVGGKNWFSAVEKTKLTKEQLFQFVNNCKEVGIGAMASAYDLERLSWLEEVGVKEHKIATRMNKDREYIKAVISTGKPFLISYRDSIEARKALSEFTAIQPVYTLYCIPSYPTKLSELCLSNVDFGDWGWFDGLSDHCEGIWASVVAMSRGAKIIERHFCLKRDNSNPDMVCSSEPPELKELVHWARRIEEIL